MQLTKSQQNRFWRDWSKVKSKLSSSGYSPAQIEAERHNLIRAATGCESLTEVNRTDGFDSLLAHLGMMLDNLSKTIETLPTKSVTLHHGHGSKPHTDGPGLRRRLLWKLRLYAHPLGGDPYILAIARDKFSITTGLHSIDDLPTDKLEQLMMTLASRHSKKARTPSPSSSSPVGAHASPSSSCHSPVGTHASPITDPF